GDLADGPDPGVLGVAPLVHQHTAPITDREPGRARQLVARPHPGSEHDDVHVQPATALELQPAHPGGTAARADLVGAGTAPHRDAQLVDQPAEGLPTAEVDLGVHQVGTVL